MVRQEQQSNIASPPTIIAEIPVLTIVLHATTTTTTTYDCASHLQLTAAANHKKRKAKAAKDGITIPPFNRYTSDDPLLIQGDRIVGNWLEWALFFQVAFWSHQVITALYSTDSVSDLQLGILLGWGYIASRLLYPLVVLAGGIGRWGPSPLVFPSTIPSYVCACWLYWRAFSVVGPFLQAQYLSK